MALRAEIVGADVGLRLGAAADACDASAGFAGSAPWLHAAHAALGDDRLVHCVLRAADGRDVGVLALERTRADWRSGSPGRASLAWPFAELGYGFGPRWLAPDAAHGDWLRALRAALPGTRLELRRCDPARVPTVVDDGVERTDGIGTWRLEAPGDVDGWLGSLRGKHRRDLHKGQREIAAGGGVWCDAACAEAPTLDAVFALHRARLDRKGVAAGAVDARGEAFLRALAAQADAGVRLTTLLHAERHVAGCLSFVARGEYLAFVSGWDRVHTRWDLGRQVLFHQLLAELPRGLRAIDFLGGDLAYKHEFGLQKSPTVDLVVHGGALAALRARVVRGALRAARRVRARWQQGVR